MNSKLNAYIESLFASAPQTEAMRELKEEMLQNLTDKYNDLIAEGKTEEEAYRIAVSSIGDVSALIGEQPALSEGGKTESAARRPRSGLITAIAVVLYALSIIPVLFLTGVTGVLLMLDLIAIATGLLIYDAPKYERPSAGVIAVAVMMYILCATPCIALNSSIGVVLLFVLIAVASGLLVYNGSSTDAPVAGDEGAQRMQKVRKTLSGIGALLTLALMIVLLAFSVTDSRRMQYYVTDDIVFDGGVAGDHGEAWDEDFDDDWYDEHSEAAPDGNAPKAEAPAQKEKSGKKGKTAADAGNAATALIGGASVPVTGIQEIEIDWVSGDVRIEQGTGSEIAFEESSAQALTDGQKLRYRVQGAKLSISYCKETWSIWNWLDLDRLNMPSKDLTVQIPASLIGQFKELEINSVSAGVAVDGVYGRKTDLESISGAISASGVAGEELSAQSTSGRITLTDCSVRELDVETTSGDAELSVSATDVELQTVSGGLRIAFDQAPRKLETEAVSGDVTVLLMQNAADFTAEVETVSGDFTCAFPTVLQNGRYIAGAGSAQYQFESVSGDVRIQAK